MVEQKNDLSEELAISEMISEGSPIFYESGKPEEPIDADRPFGRALNRSKKQILGGLVITTGLLALAGIESNFIPNFAHDRLLSPAYFATIVAAAASFCYSLSEIPNYFELKYLEKLFMGPISNS
jgi:hypothetical protein